MPRFLLLCCLALALCLVAGCSSSDTATPPEENATVDSAPYPGGTKEQFIGSCTSTFINSAIENPQYSRETAAPLASFYCECAFTCMERTIPFQDFEAYDIALSENKEPNATTHAKAQACMKDCQEKMLEQR